MKNELSGLTDQIADLINSYSNDAGKQARRGVASARDNVESFMSDLSDRGNAAYDAASSFEESLEEVIQDRPIMAVGLALGIGFLLGAAWKR